MFCPECGQQQVSNEVRFCSRCGFQLAGVTGLLATRGALPAGATTTALAPAPETPRRKGVRQGGKLILIGIFLIPLFAIVGEVTRIIPSEAALIGVLCFLAGLLRVIYAALFEDGPFRRQKMPQIPTYVPPGAPPLGPPSRSAELPPARSVTPHSYAPPRHDTAEISFRPSVTEHETQLLDDQRDTSPR